MTEAELESELDAAAAELTSHLGNRVRRNEPLAPLTTYRVGGPASIYVEVAHRNDLDQVARTAAKHELSVLVVGRGSNMLVADQGFAGIAVSLNRWVDQIEIGDDSVVAVGAAVALPVAARRTAAVGLTGFEWAVGVPGSIGGAVRMNAGGHGSDMAGCLVDADIFELSNPTAGLTARPVAALGLGFRSSRLGPGDVVVRVRLGLQPGDREESERLISEIVRWRREHQPGGQNCGSVFVNPVPGEVTAGGLIDGIGLRGMRIGTACVSEKHANFVQASPGGSAADVRAVIEAVRERVAAETGYRLRSEVRLVGFEGADPLSFEEPDR